MLHIILYVSTISAGMTQRELQQVVARSQQVNRRLDVTGVLAAGRGVFAQVLEGNASALALTLERIRLDQRHSDIRLVLDAPAKLRLFDRWSMKLVVDDSSAQLALDARDGKAPAQALLERLRVHHAEDPHC